MFFFFFVLPKISKWVQCEGEWLYVFAKAAEAVSTFLWKPKWIFIVIQICSRNLEFVVTHFRRLYWLHCHYTGDSWELVYRILCFPYNRMLRMDFIQKYKTIQSPLENHIVNFYIKGKMLLLSSFDNFFCWAPVQKDRSLHEGQKQPEKKLQNCTKISKCY